MAASFAIIIAPNGATSVEFVPDDCAVNDIGIDSRAAGGTIREYFVTCKGVEPKECHMTIKSGSRIRFGAPLPRDATRDCVGGCASPFKCEEIAGRLDDGSTAIFCSCTGLRVAITDPHTGDCEFVELAGPEFPEPKVKHPKY